MLRRPVLRICHGAAGRRFFRGDLLKDLRCLRALLFGKLSYIVESVLGELIRRVKIVAVGGHHRLDRGGVDVHYNTNAAVFDVVVNNTLLHIFLGYRLYSLVDSQLDRVAVLGVNVLLILERHICLVRVSGGDDTPGRAGQIIVILIFYALKSLIVHTGKAYNGRRKLIVGIIALVIVKKRDNVRQLCVLIAQLFRKLEYFLSFVALDLSLHYYIIGILLDLFKHVVVIKIKYL